METLAGNAALCRLQDKGVRTPHPGGVYLGATVNPEFISGDGVVLHPGTRIEGAQTVISAGSVIGGEGPATVVDCQLGRGVELKAGYFADSVFLDHASLGSGAHVRAGTILEEQASGAHCVGLKQTILFPFVTLGSLINFCDALMAGGTSRTDHSEVGSSYIHFNFTPDGTKTTASLFGDVPRGVMLDQPRIFLGGQGGAVGPLRTGFGTVVGAGSVIRGDILADSTLWVEPGAKGVDRPVSPRAFRGLTRIVERNLSYLAQLVALQVWYENIRRPFFDAVELGPEVYQGALRALACARTERATRLAKMVATVPAGDDPGRAQLVAHCSEVLASFDARPVPVAEQFVAAVAAVRVDGDYLRTIQGLPPDVRAAGVAWLSAVVTDLETRAASFLPDLHLFQGL
ncbi:MAG: UDP-N-acetylglucosamine pyrophosphorylase [Candidatus Nanopelagicales bacterium]